MPKNNNYIQIPLITKTLGWGIIDKYSNKVIFMGGYGHNCPN